MQSTEQNLREALQELADEYVLLLTDYFAAPHKKFAENSPVYKKAMKAIALPTAEVMVNGLTQAETDASASVSGLTAAPECQL